MYVLARLYSRIIRSIISCHWFRVQSVEPFLYYFLLSQSQAGVITEMHAALVDFLKKKNFSKRKPETVVAFFRIAMKLQSCVSRLHEVIVLLLLLLFSFTL